MSGAGTLLHACDFVLCVSMSDLVVYADDDGDEVSVHSELRAVLDLLALDVDLVRHYHDYMRGGPRGDGDVHVYRASAGSASLFGLDLYRAVTDSQDLVSLIVQCARPDAPAVFRALASLFDSASCQIKFERAHHADTLLALTDPGRYPSQMPDSPYRQQLVMHPAA